MTDRLPVEEVLRGLEISPMPERWTPVDAICIVKCLDTDGRPLWAMRMTEGINKEELLGTMVVQTGMLEKEMIEDWDIE